MKAGGYDEEPGRRRDQVARDLEEIENTLADWAARLPQLQQRARNLRALVEGNAPEEEKDGEEDGSDGGDKPDAFSG